MGVLSKPGCITLQLGPKLAGTDSVKQPDGVVSLSILPDAKVATFSRRQVDSEFLKPVLKLSSAATGIPGGTHDRANGLPICACFLSHLMFKRPRSLAACPPALGRAVKFA